MMIEMKLIIMMTIKMIYSDSNDWKSTNDDDVV